MGTEISTIDGILVSVQHALSVGINQLLFPACVGLVCLAVVYGVGLTVLRGR